MPKGNSLPGQLLRRLPDGITALDSDDSVRVIVLRSVGTGPLCAGASFDEPTRVSTPRGSRVLQEILAGDLATIRVPKFVVRGYGGRPRAERWG